MQLPSYREKDNKQILKYTTFSAMFLLLKKNKAEREGVGSAGLGWGDITILNRKIGSY